MKRARVSSPGLKHLAFFEALGDAEEGSAASHSATAGLLALRLIDHWDLAGPVMVEPESVSVRSVREAIMKLAANDPQREVQLGIINTMQTLREVDLQPVLPRLFAYAGMLERRGQIALAADVYETVVRYGEEEYEPDLVIDSFERLGFCQRTLGALREAEISYTTAVKIARRAREVARALRSRVGLASVMVMRGNLPKAEEMLQAIESESDASGCVPEKALALHGRSVVAQRRGHVDEALCLAHDALKITSEPNARDRVLGEMAAYLIASERFDAARDALMILDVTAVAEQVRATARVNLVTLAARSGDRQLFEHARSQLEGMPIPKEHEVNYLIESARGFRRFGEAQRAKQLLESARSLAQKHGLSRSVFEAEELLATRTAEVHTKSGEIPLRDGDPAAHVVRELRQMAAELAA